MTLRDSFESGHGRLPAHLEVASLLRRAQAEGGFGTVVHRGEADRGVLILEILERGAFVQCLERALNRAGYYAWQPAGPSSEKGPTARIDWIQRRRKFDPDLWLIELDVPSAERFIAETTAIG